MISDERLLDLCRSLADVVRSGLPLGEALDILARSSSQGRALAGVAKLTARGIPLHEALQAQRMFPPVFIALVRAGEEGGQFDRFLDRFADCLELRVEFRRRIERALVYPAFAAILAGAVFLFFSLKAVPMILGPFLASGAAPPQALWLRRLGEFLGQRWPLVLASALAAWLALRALARSGPGRKTWALAGHWLPGVRFAAEQARLHQISTTMGLLLQAGIPFGAMMEILAQFFQYDPVTRRHFARASAMLSKGSSFCASVGGCLPPEDRRSLEIAEKSGRLDETLLRLGKAHYDRHSHRLKLLATAFKISATVALAPLCFALILTLLWPVLSLFKEGKGFAASDQAQSRQDDPGLRPGAGSPGVQVSTWSLFNEAQAREIADFMRKHAPRSQDSGGGQWPRKPRLGPMPSLRMSPIKGFQFQKIQPTSIQPTDIGGFGGSPR